MDDKKFNSIVEDLNEFRGVEEVILLDKEGNILFKVGELTLSPEDAKKLLNSWKNKDPSLTYQNYRYVMIKNEEIQLAAKNTTDGKGNIAGSITNEGDYLIVHVAKETDIILLEWSILVNKLAWS